jgi:hypothetical protein
MLYGSAQWAQLGALKRYEMRAYVGMSVALMASLGGSQAQSSSSGVWYQYDPTSLGQRAAEYVMDAELDGLDIDLEGFPNDGSGTPWLKELTGAVHATFAKASEAQGRKKYLISHAPQV